VIRELRNVLKYESFFLLDGTMIRVIDGGRATSDFGPNGEYSLSLVPTFFKDSSPETIQVQIRFMGPRIRDAFAPLSAEKKQETQMLQATSVELINTTILLKSGDKTVVGVSKSAGDKGLILIISGKPVK
jgi:hypothetical protein